MVIAVQMRYYTAKRNYDNITCLAYKTNSILLKNVMLYLPHPRYFRLHRHCLHWYRLILGSLYLANQF